MVACLRIVTHDRSHLGRLHSIVYENMPLIYRLRLVWLILAIAASTSTARAQATVDPIEFAYDYPRLGGELGLTPTWQSGMYRTGCGEFTEGTRINPIVAIAYDHPIVDGQMRLEVLGGWLSHSVSSSYNSRETVILQTAGGTARVDVDFENQGEFNATYFFLLPSIRFYLLEALYAGAGVSAGFLAGARSQYTKTIISKSVMIPELGLSEISYPEEESDDPYSKIFPEEERPDANGFGLDLAAYIGAEFKIGERMTMGPRVLFAYPVTSVVNDPELRLLSMQFTLGARFALFR
jgi:hypothetical protein